MSGRREDCQSQTKHQAVTYSYPVECRCIVAMGPLHSHVLKAGSTAIRRQKDPLVLACPWQNDIHLSSPSFQGLNHAPKHARATVELALLN